MSNIALEETVSTCPAEIVLRGPNVSVGSLALIESVFRLQAEVAHDELGDTIMEGNELALQAQEQAGTKLNDITAISLANAANGCLQKRYLGICDAAGKCTGRKFVDAKLAELGISRYKSDDINQEV